MAANSRVHHLGGSSADRYLRKRKLDMDDALAGMVPGHGS